jgi:Domain of unknown function (DUF4189)
MRSTLAVCVALAGAVLSFSGPARAAGAIVSTPERGTYIYMTHRPSSGFAADLAMSDCMGKFGSGCRVLMAYGSGCMAIAQSHDSSHHSGWAVKGFPGQAQEWALAQCEKYGAPCTVDVARCE